MTHAGQKDAREVLHRSEEPEEDDGDKEDRDHSRHSVRITNAFGRSYA